MMRVAIYTRFSSDSQREASLEDQERLCRQDNFHARAKEGTLTDRKVKH